MTFIDGSTNFKSSTLLDHVATDGHKRTVKEKNHADAISTGSSTHPEKVIHEVPMYSAIFLEKWPNKREKHWSNFTI